MVRKRSHSKASPQHYTDKDAYEVYDALLADRVSSGSAFAIQQETTPLPKGPDSGWGADKPESCLTPDLIDTFKDAITDYDGLNGNKWLLQRNFSTRLNYELLDSTNIGLLLDDNHREAFYKRFPGGLYVMSGVGFNKQRNKAIAFFGHSCGDLCGAWSLHLLEKLNGKWQEIDGAVRCVTVS